MNKQIGLITLFCLLAGLMMPAQAAESATAILTEAKKLFKQADKLQGAWVSTGKLIKKADAAMKKGDRKTALKLASKARKEAQLSLAQAREQLKNWSEPPYIRQ